jgi:HEAT repeat protein
MLRWVHIALAVLLVMLAGVIAWHVFRASREREPVYQGKRLSGWLETLYDEKKPIGDRAEQAIRRQNIRRVEQAIRQIGTNALPLLIEGLQAQDTKLKQLMMTWVQKQKLVHFNFKSANQRRIEAILGYQALGPLASAQVPSLSGILTNDPSPDVRRAVAQVLASIGPEARLAASALFHAAKDTNDAVRACAFFALGGIRPASQFTIPVLVAGLDDPYPETRWHAAMSLGRYGQEAKAAVPALLRTLATNNAAGTERDAAAGALKQIRDAAAWALKQIDPEAAAKAGVE